MSIRVMEIRQIADSEINFERKVNSLLEQGWEILGIREKGWEILGIREKQELLHYTYVVQRIVYILGRPVHVNKEDDD